MFGGRSQECADVVLARRRVATSTYHGKAGVRVQETRQLAEFVSSMSFEDLPDPIVSRALDLIIDQIGVQIGCCTLPWARAVFDSVANRQGGEATIVRYGQRVTIGEAALVNGTFGHSFELDDANPVGHGHAGAE